MKVSTDKIICRHTHGVKKQSVKQTSYRHSNVRASTDANSYTENSKAQQTKHLCIMSIKKRFKIGKAVP